MINSILFIRIAKTGFSNFIRNWVLSVSASLVMTISLLIFALLVLIFGLANYSVRTIQERIDISIFLNKGLAEDRILDIKRSLENDPLVKDVEYISAQKALDDFKIRHVNNKPILSALNEVDENPLLATLRLKAKKLESYPELAEKISKGGYAGFIKEINYNDNRQIIDRLTKILSLVIRVGIGLVVIFSVIAIMVMLNTLKLTIFNRREEVEIMRLVGATNWYIRGPFLAESFLYSLAATLATGVLLVFIYSKIINKIIFFMGSPIDGTGVINFWVLLGVLFLIALVLSGISTLLGIRKHLKI